MGGSSSMAGGVKQKNGSLLPTPLLTALLMTPPAGAKSTAGVWGWVSGCLGLLVWVFGCLGVLVSACLGVRVYGGFGGLGVWGLGGLRA